MVDPDELTTFPVLVTCHTEGCGNAEIAIELELYDVNMKVVCGVCSKVINDKIIV